MDFTPAVPGADCRLCAGELAQLLHTPSLTINGAAAHPEDPVPAGAVIVKTGQPPAAPAAVPVSAPTAAWTGTLNGTPLSLPPKPDGAPYYLMDLLERSGIDFDHVERPVVLRYNGHACTFQQTLQNGDCVEITCEETTENPLP